MTMLWCLPGFASLSLLIHLSDSTEIVCSLAKEPKMSFQDKSMTLSSIDGTVGQWNFSDVESWNFADVKDVDAVNPVNADKARILIEDGKLTVAGIKADNIAVYDAAGRLVTPELNAVEDNISIDINGLERGSYLLKAGDSSIKFLVQ